MVELVVGLQPRVGLAAQALVAEAALVAARYADLHHVEYISEQ